MPNKEDRRFWINRLIHTTASLREDARRMQRNLSRESQAYWLRGIIYWSRRHHELTQRVAECSR